MATGREGSWRTAAARYLNLDQTPDRPIERGDWVRGGFGLVVAIIVFGLFTSYLGDDHVTVGGVLVRGVLWGAILVPVLVHVTQRRRRDG